MKKILTLEGLTYYTQKIKNAYLKKTGDSKDNTTTFTSASTRANLSSGEKHSVLFGKISKYFNDLKTVAFSGSYTDLSNKPSIPPAVSVKGNAESAYRSGNVNLTPENIGAVKETAWTAITKGATWSRICAIRAENGYMGFRGILSVSATRSNFSSGASFLISAGVGAITTIIQLGGSYNNFRYRILTQTGLTIMFEIYDSEAGITSASTQSWRCNFVPFGNMQDGSITPYTEFIDGTIVPNGWNASADKATESRSTIVADKFSGTLYGASTYVSGAYSGGGGAQPPSYIPSARVRFAMMSAFKGVSNLPTYADCMLMDTYSGTDVPWVTALAITKTGTPRAYIASGAKGNTTSWSKVVELITSENIGSQGIGTASKLNKDAGAPFNPVYFKNGVPVECVEILFEGNESITPINAGGTNGYSLINTSFGCIEFLQRPYLNLKAVFKKIRLYCFYNSGNTIEHFMYELDMDKESNYSELMTKIYEGSDYFRILTMKVTFDSVEDEIGIYYTLRSRPYSNIASSSYVSNTFHIIRVEGVKR